MAERKRRLTKGETFTFVRDEHGELLVRCLFCNAPPYSFKNAWGHKCNENDLKPVPPLTEDNDAA